MTRVAVVLSGCGFMDGAEIREAVLSLLYLDVRGADVTIFAPDIDQHHVVNHFTAQESPNEVRNVLVESARIARSQIKPLSEANADNFDALIIPGGFGVAKNLSDLAIKAAQASVYEPFAQLVKSFHDARKPIGAICIAPAVLSHILADASIQLTIGDDVDTAQLINNHGNNHHNAASDDAIIDEIHKIATCSAYMREDRISEIAKGIEKVVNAVLDMV